jgi:hypothetical protein
MKLSIILFCILLYICLSNFYFCSNNTIEKYQQIGYKDCVPKARLVLYTSSRCPHCVDAKEEWKKFKDHIKDNCKYSRIVEVDQKEDREIDDPEIQYVPTIKLYIKEDTVNNTPAKVVTFDNHVKAKLLEEFLISNLVPSTTENFTGHYYTDCDKGKMYGKFYTLCDNEHQQWNAS